MSKINVTVTDELLAVHERTLLLADSLDSIAQGLCEDSRRSHPKIDSGMGEIASIEEYRLTVEVGRVLAQARTTGPIVEKVSGVVQVAAPTATEWVCEYARQIHTRIVDEFSCDRWWPAEWELCGSNYEWDIQYLKKRPPADFLLAIRDEISPLFRCWRKKGPKIRAEIDWESRRAIDRLESQRSPFCFSGGGSISFGKLADPHVSFGNWSTPQAIKPPPSTSPTTVQKKEEKRVRGPESTNTEPYSILAGRFTAKSTAGQIADTVESDSPLRGQLRSAGVDVDNRKEVIRLANRFLRTIRPRKANASHRDA